MLGCEGLRPHYSMTKFTIYNYTLTFFAHNYFPFPFISWSMSVCIIYMKLNIHVLVKLFFHHCHQEFFAPLRLCSKVYPVSVPSRSVLASLEDFQQFIEIWSFSFLVMSSSILSIAFLSYLSISSTLFLYTTLLLAFLFHSDHRWPLLTL